MPCICGLHNLIQQKKWQKKKKQLRVVDGLFSFLPLVQVVILDFKNTKKKKKDMARGSANIEAAE